MVCVVFLSAFNIAKADPNIQAQIIDVQNPGNFCSGATVIASIAPSWVPGTYDVFRVESAVLYLREDLGGGVYNDKPIASVGQQPDGEVYIEFSPVYGIGELKVEITYYAYAGSTGGTFTDVSNFYDGHYLISSIAPAINSFGVLNTATPNTNPYDLAGCLASGYDLDLDFDYVYGSNSNGTAITFEMFDVNGCSDPMGSGNRVVVEEFTEDVYLGESVEEYKERLNDVFKSFVSNTTGHFRVRLTIEATDCGPARTADFCIYITNTPSNADFILAGCRPNIWDPIPIITPEHTYNDAPLVGGKTVALNGNLSSGDFSYYRFKLEMEETEGAQDFINIPLGDDPQGNNYGTNTPVVPDPSGNNYLNLQAGINGIIETDANGNSPYFVDDNVGHVYRVTLILGSDCGEVSQFSFFKTDLPCKNKSAPAGSIEEVGDGIAVFPQPAHDLLNIHLSDFKEVSFEIVGSSGRSALQGHLFGEQTQVDITSLPKGFYFIRFYNANGDVMKNEKLLIQ